MEIQITEQDSGTIKAIASGVNGLEVDIVVHGEYDPGQPYKRASMADPIGDPVFEADFSIEKTYVYVGVICGEERYLPVDLSREQNAEIELAIEKYIEEEKR